MEDRQLRDDAMGLAMIRLVVDSPPCFDTLN